jgi:hypothetical protein
MPPPGITGALADDPVSSILVSMLLLGVRWSLLFLFLEACSVAAAQLGPSNVLSARLENIATVPEKASIHVNMRNTGERPITAFSIGFYQLTPTASVLRVEAAART